MTISAISFCARTPKISANEKKAAKARLEGVNKQLSGLYNSLDFNVDTKNLHQIQNDILTLENTKNVLAKKLTK